MRCFRTNVQGTIPDFTRECQANFLKNALRAEFLRLNGLTQFLRLHIVHRIMPEITQALQDAYAAFNRGDIDACLAALDPNVEWIEPTEFPGGGTYHGHAGVARYLSQSRAPWATIKSEPEKFIPAGDKIVVFVHTQVQAKADDPIVEGRIADVYTVENGSVIRMQACVDREAAMRYAGLNGAG